MVKCIAFEILKNPVVKFQGNFEGFWTVLFVYRV